MALRALGSGHTVLIGPLQSGAAWSTIKVPVILARYRLAESLRQPSGQIDARVAAAITASDNAAAQSLFDDISTAEGGLIPASTYVQQELRAAGDLETVINTAQPPGGFSTFGQTQWSLSAGTRFYRALALGCLGPAPAAQRITQLMAEITPDQRWGLGQASFGPGTQVLFKGGWGPDPAGRHLVRQFGIIETRDGRGFAVGLMDRPSDGAFTSGAALLTRLAEAVASTTHADSAPAATGC